MARASDCPWKGCFHSPKASRGERKYSANISQSLEKTAFLSGKKCLNEKGSSITLDNWLHHSRHGVKQDAALKASKCHNLERSHSLPLFCRRAKSGSETGKDLHKFTQVFGAYICNFRPVLSTLKHTTSMVFFATSNERKAQCLIS